MVIVFFGFLFYCFFVFFFFFFQAEDGIRDLYVTGVQTCALPISVKRGVVAAGGLPMDFPTISLGEVFLSPTSMRSEEHTSELQSRRDLVCRLLLEKKNKKKTDTEPRTVRTPGRAEAPLVGPGRHQ